ncbi:MAG: phage tail tape measure protein [Prevotella sp.]|nr:phage tail tape measure protein [Prevotella sp.]
MATRHELIHIDFVANAGKANPVLKSLQQSCEDARIAKENLDKQLADAKAMKAPAEEITRLEGLLKAQTKTWEGLQRGVREYTKGIDTLSKGIKEFNAGTLDEMSAKFNKSVYNAAKNAQMMVKTGSAEWNQLQRLMDATDRNVTRAREDVVTLMQSLKDGASVSTVQLTRARDVLEDLSRLAVTNSEEWRGLKAQMREVDAAVASVAETEKRLKGEVTTVEDAMAMSNALTKESIALRHADGEAALNAARTERQEIEARQKTLANENVEHSKRIDQLGEEIERQEKLDELIARHNEKVADANTRRQNAQTRLDKADADFKSYANQLKDQKDATRDLNKEVKKLEKQVSDANKTDEERLSLTEQLTKKQEEYNNSLAREEELKKSKTQASREKSSASSQRDRAEQDIEELGKQTFTRKSEAEVGQLRQQKEQETEALRRNQQAIDDNAQAINRLNKAETEAAIEMAQAENVSMEKVKQAIDLLKKKIETEATDEQTMQQRGEAINRLTERYTQMSAEVAKLSKPIADRLSGELGGLKETEIRQSIDAANQLIKTYETGSKEATELGEAIVRAEKHLKEYGVEAARTAQREADAAEAAAKKQREAVALMESQLSKGSALTESALKAQVNYWRQLADDPKAAADAVAKYTANMEKAQQLLDVKNRVDVRMKAGRLSNTENYSISELREGIEAAKQMQQTFRLTDDEVKKLSEDIVAAETRISKVSVETERTAQKQREAVELMEKQLASGGNLTENALKAQVQYWQRLADDPKTAAEAVAQYTANMEKAQQLLDANRESTIRDKAGRLQNMDNYSVAELREGIEAAKQMQQTFKLTDDEVKRLSEDIVAAETRISKVSVENERAAQKERQAIEQMEKQLSGLTIKMAQHENVSLDVLKAQHNYWQRLIDDPKNAGQNLQQYEDNLKEVERLQRRMVNKQGQEALDFFRGDTSNASADEIKRQADALKLWRNSLPGKDKADVIAEIDGYLVQAGQAAKIAAEQAMSFRLAMQVSKTAGTGSFKGTVEQLTQAKKVLEDMSAKAQKGGLAWRRMQEALQRIELELKNVGHLSQEVQAVLDSPKGKSFNALKQAVEQGRLALQSMDRTTKEGQKAFDELAKKVKAADLEMKQLAGTSKASLSAFEKAWSRLKTYIGLYVGAAVAMQKLVGTLSDIMDLSDKMGEVRKTTGFTADEVGRLTTQLKRIDTRTSLNGLIELSAAAGQLGLKTQEDVEGFTIAANKLMVALPEMGREGATEMLKVALATGEIDKIRRQMEQGLIDGSSATAVAMEKVGSTIDRLRATSAATAPAITDFVKRVGAVGAQSGITIDQVAALGSTVDALGMRVEMSATALSRMIPAIKNNAFAVAKTIGVTPETLRNLFETGRGMEAILMVFQRIKDAGMDADSVEKMLSMGGMQEIMKELNQQGARAGIVFAGLSQNVDELRRQLGVAAQAYEENIAIQQEYDKMNETTAAKWERLKNQLEEAFVGDTAQRLLGGLIDVLRGLVDFLTGNVGPAFSWLSGLVQTFIVYWGVLKIGLGEGIFVKAVAGMKALGSGLLNIVSNTQAYIKYSVLLKRAQTEQAKAAIEARMAQEGLNKAMIANVWMALVAAIGFAIYKLAGWISSMKEAGKEAAKFENELMKEQMKVENLTDAIGKARVKTEEAENGVKKAKQALDAAKKATDGSRESTERLTKAETDLVVAEENKRKAMAESKRLIEQFNTEYGKYLGFMLSEVASNIELAQARELVNDKLRETITLKRKEAALERVEKNLGEDRDDEYADLWDFVRRKATTKDSRGRDVNDPTKAAKVMNALTKAAQQANSTEEDFKKAARQIFKDNGIANYETLLGQATSYYKQVDKIRKKSHEVEMQFTAEEAVNRQQSQKDLTRQYKSANDTYVKLEQTYAKATGDARKQAAADLLKQMDTMTEMVDNSKNYYDLSDADEKKSYDTFIKNADERVNGLKAQREKLLKEAGNAYKSRTTVGGGTTTSIPTSPWGSRQPAESTNYADMNAETLVARRKQMKDFVNAIQSDTDVEAVLKEDAALKKAIEKGMSSDMRTVIEWYNTERMKIQNELHARHLTNTGDWMDPKKGSKKASKMVQDEMKYYLDELDAYFTERKAKIQEDLNDGQISEAEAWNRTLKNEAEWYQRRGNLQKLYSQQRKEVAQDERDAIFGILSERTGDSTDYIQKDIANTVKFIEQVGSEKGKAAMDKIYGDIDLGMERSFLKTRNAIGKQVQAIADIIDKENPFSGIVKSLQDNLGKMDLLLTDIKDAEQRTVDEETKRTMFILEQSTKGYALTWEEMMSEMAKRGWEAWAKEIEASPQMQERLMHQTYRVFEKVQDAIKKEASELKKQADIMWSNILMPGGDGKTTVKDAFEQAISALGIEQGRVSRANSLIGAGAASDRVADRLAIKQMQVQLAMQQYQYNMVRKIAKEKIETLRKEAEADEARGKAEDARAKRMQADNAQQALNLATRKEQTEELKLQEDIIAKTEESQNRLYTALKEWGDLLASSLQSIFEASNAGNAEYYNELAKLNLTGKGGPGAGTYIVIDNEGTSDARAHYEYLDERQALERQHEIEQENARAEAWKKVMDDFNNKMSEQITDWLNAAAQQASTDANTAALGTLTTAENANTNAMTSLSEQMAQLAEAFRESTTAGDGGLTDGSTTGTGETSPESGVSPAAQQKINDQNAVTQNKLENDKKEEESEKNKDKKMATSSQSTFAKMTLAANLYGIAYQTMSNDNLSTAQKVQLFAVQAAGNAAIAMLTTDMATTEGEAAVSLPGILGKAASQLGPIAGPIAFAAMSALLGGLMGMAVSKITKSKSQIAQATGASVSAGRLATGMLTYAEGNVNEFTDPASLTPGRSYNVDGADGKTYRAKYTGKNPRTHITNGPEFHLVGEAGSEAIIDAHTTRLMQMDDTGIWQAIQTLYNGGRISGGFSQRRRGRGVRAFADGNLDDFEEMGSDMGGGDMGGMSTEQMAAFQSSLDRNNELLERALTEGIKGVFDVHGTHGLVNTYDRAKKEALRHGERYT